MKYRELSLKNRVLIPIVSILLVAGIVSYFLIISSLATTVGNDIDKRLHAKVESINAALKQSAQAGLQVSSLVAGLPTVVSTYESFEGKTIENETSEIAQVNRDKLRNFTKPFINSYKNNLGEEPRLHFHTPPARSLLRTWREKQAKRNGKWIDVSDDLSGFRNTILELTSDKTQNVAGIEIGRGGFAIRGISQIKGAHHDILGSVELLQDFNGLYLNAKTNDKEIISAFMYKDFLPIATKLQNESKNPHLGDLVLVATTDQEKGLPLLKKIHLNKIKKAEIASIDNYKTISFPIYDYKGAEIGVGNYMVDISDELNFITNVKTGVISAVLLVLVLVIMITYYIFYVFLKPIDKEIGDLDSITNEINKAANDLSGASQTIAESTAEQAASLEETSASLEEIAGMTERNQQNAENSYELSRQVTELSQQTGNLMKELSSAMTLISQNNGEIQQLVHNIEEIKAKTTIIDEIVFQTKLLSFNASVEAERAGEHGRGFAVVAQEVGNLAQISGKAAIEISKIVKESVTKAVEVSKQNKERVDKGNQTVSQTTLALSQVQNIAGQVNKASDLILKASKEQTAGIKQISVALGQLDQVTQSNSTVAERTASASRNLSIQVTDVKEGTENLKLAIKGKTDTQTYHRIAVQNEVIEEESGSFESID